MNLIETGFDGLFIVESNVFKDNRGLFIKTYNETLYKNLDLCIDIKERYYSVSKKNVVRGMHFQIPPSDHVKIVNVIAGQIVDVVLDIRSSSKTYGKYFSMDLSEGDGKSLYIPKGFAHGFRALIDDTIVEYNQTSEYDSSCDKGIRWNSFGFNWEIDNPIISDRDNGFDGFNKSNIIFQ